MFCVLVPRYVIDGHLAEIYGTANRGVIDMGHIDISITLLKQYSLLSLVNTYRNVSKYQKHEDGHFEKKLRAEYCWCC